MKILTYKIPGINMNLGSMTRGSLTEDNIDRTPRFGYIQVTKDREGMVDLHTEAIELDVKPADEVFDLERRERQDQLEDFKNWVSRHPQEVKSELEDFVQHAL